MTFKTPGVYVQEISVFPPSVAEVETAIPAFIGYTERASGKGTDLTNVPTRISSLLDYHELFGGEFPITAVTVNVNENNNFAVTSVDIATRFYMYEALRLFFDNGGGNCYIVSVGNYSDTVANGNEATNTPGLRMGLAALEKYDEPTIILFPDAVLLVDEANLFTLQQLALGQCAKLQDRVSVLDLNEPGNRSHDASVAAFRNGIGINNLKYGAAYTPWLYTAYAKAVPFTIFRNTVQDSGDNTLSLDALTSDSDLNALVAAANSAIGDVTTVNATVDTAKTPANTLKDRYKSLKDAITQADTDNDNDDAFAAVLDFVRDLVDGLAAWNTSLVGTNLRSDLSTYATSTLRPALEALIALEKNTDVLARSDLADAAAVDTAYDDLDGTGYLADTVASTGVGGDANNTDYDDGGNNNVFETLQLILADLDPVFEGANNSVHTFVTQMLEAADTHASLSQTTLYNDHSIISSMVEQIKRELSRVPPSGGVVGRYAFVDDSRGVWKAPANVGVNAVRGPVEAIDDSEQENLNVDVTGGKSINAIRSFTGRGPAIVWGARTLAGNDNEWRYVPVRRFFNMVEESVKKSTAFAVFEPNSAPLWTKVKGMIDNYLIQKWRDGALQGAVPEDAFFVKIGLGETMTAQDILEGRLIVEIGMAVVRPAEFIILKFMHKLPVS